MSNLRNVYVTSCHYGYIMSLYLQIMTLSLRPRLPVDFKKCQGHYVDNKVKGPKMAVDPKH